jgi:hypothetical protein
MGFENAQLLRISKPQCRVAAWTSERGNDFEPRTLSDDRMTASGAIVPEILLIEAVRYWQNELHARLCGHPPLVGEDE